MSLPGLQLVVFLFFTGKAYAGFGDKSYKQSDVYIFFERTYPCDNSETALDFSFELRNINDDGVKAVTAEFDLEDKEFTEKWTAIGVIDKWNNGNWDLNFHNPTGTVCGLLNKWVPGAWEKFKKQVEPPISESCFIKPGHYKITDFQADQSDIKIPVSIPGKYRATAKFFDEVGEEMLCQMAEVEVKKH